MLRLFDHTGYEVMATFCGRSNLLEMLALVFFGYLVGAQTLHRIERVGHGGNIAGIDSG